MFSEKYPVTGLQRETQEIQGDYIQEMRERLFGDPYDEAVFASRVTEIFRLEVPPTSEEVRDFRIFAEHAMPRLVSSAAHQPSFKAWFSHRTVPETEEQNVVSRNLLDKKLHQTLATGAPVRWNIIGHDVIHASVAYLNSEGKKLRPKYNEYDNLSGNTSTKDLDCVLEETIVMFFQGEMLYKELLKGSFTSSQSLEEWLVQDATSPKDTERIRKEFGPLAVEVLDQSPSADSLLRYIELLGIHIAADKSASGEMAKTIKEKRPPYFVEMIKRVCENTESEIPDSNILFHEWQRLMEPLLRRLRNKELA